jgi:hypothetical protein
MVMVNSTSGTAEHLAPDVLAAFLDVQLSDEENVEIRQHLAQCEECYQVFTDAAAFLQEEAEEEAKGTDDVLPQEGKLLPFVETPERQLLPPAPRRAFWRGRWAAAAATILATVGLSAFTASQVQVSTDGLVLRLNSMRGADPALSLLSLEQAFDLGGDTLNLRVALDNGGDLLTVLQRIHGSLGEEAPPALTQILTGKEKLTPERQLAAARAFLEADPRSLAIEPAWFNLGAWVQANRLAVETGNQSYQQSWKNWLYLEKLLFWDARALGTEATSNLRKARNLLRQRGSLTLGTLDTLSPPSEFEEEESPSPDS